MRLTQLQEAVLKRLKKTLEEKPTHFYYLVIAARASKPVESHYRNWLSGQGLCELKGGEVPYIVRLAVRYWVRGKGFALDIVEPKEEEEVYTDPATAMQNGVDSVLRAFAPPNISVLPSIAGKFIGQEEAARLSAELVATQKVLAAKEAEYNELLQALADGVPDSEDFDNEVVTRHLARAVGIEL